MENADLWPDFEFIPVRQPRTVLKEQASFLMQKTNNILSVDINTTQMDKSIFQVFTITAPALNNYKYELLRIKHDVFFYPCQVYTNGGLIAVVEEEDQLISALKSIFSDKQTVNIITSLVSQSIAE